MLTYSYVDLTRDQVLRTRQKLLGELPVTAVIIMEWLSSCTTPARDKMM
jgi:hypothetical protein